MIKTDAEGQKQLDRTFGGTDEDVARSVQQTSDGGYILAGQTASPVSGLLYTELKAPLTATANPTYSKVGTASCVSYLGLIARGDASIEAAIKNGGITKIHHIDYEGFSVLGIYAKYTVAVYGE